MKLNPITIIKNYISKKVEEGVKKEVEKVRKAARGIAAVSPMAKEYGEPLEVDNETLWRCYKQDPYTRAMVDALINSVTAPGWTLIPRVENPDEKNKQILQDFFDNPNPQETMDEILEELVRDLGIDGNGYAEIVFENGKPKELWMLDGTRMKIKVDEHGMVLGYRQVMAPATAETTLVTEGEPEWEPHEVLHIRFATKGNTPYGLSFLETLASEIQTDLYAQIYNRVFFEHGAKLKRIFKMKGASENKSKGIGLT